MNHVNIEDLKEYHQICMEDPDKNAKIQMISRKISKIIIIENKTPNSSTAIAKLSNATDNHANLVNHFISPHPVEYITSP